MKLHHTVNHIPTEEIARSIEVNGLIPQVANVYKDLVPEKIRRLPVVWLAEGVWQGWDLPVFEVNSEDLDRSKLYRNNIVYEADKSLNWWLYQGNIPSNIISRVQISSLNWVYQLWLLSVFLVEPIEEE